MPMKLLHTKHSVWAQIIRYTALLVGAASQILAQEQSGGGTAPPVIRAKIEAWLGGYETSAPRPMAQPRSRRHTDPYRNCS